MLDDEAIFVVILEALTDEDVEEVLMEDEVLTEDEEALVEDEVGFVVVVARLTIMLLPAGPFSPHR